MNKVLCSSLCLIALLTIGCASKTSLTSHDEVVSSRPHDLTYLGFDQNSDSKITIFEYLNQLGYEYSAMMKTGENSVAAKSCKKKWCQKADTNRDGKIVSKEYFLLAVSVFNNADKDADRTLSKTEFVQLQKMGLAK